MIKQSTETKSSDTNSTKKYVQFSKKVVMLCIVNLFLIEFFSMWMIYRFGDTSQLSYLITAIAAECLGCVVWYMKNSETEKKARIQAEVDRLKIESDMSKCGNSESGNDTESGSELDNLLESVDSIIESTNSSNSAVG